MKKQHIVVILLVAVLAGTYVVMSGHQSESSVAVEVAKALGEKYDHPADATTIGVETDTGAFAKGSVQFAGEQGGGLWFAARTANGWELAYDGNGIVPCAAAEKYDFPTDMIPQCVDAENGNELMQR